MSRLRIVSWICVLGLGCPGVRGADVAGGEDREQVFSGPQVGERLGTFKVQGAYGRIEAKQLDLVSDAGGGPLLLVFVNGANRPAARLTRTLMNYGEMRRGDGLFPAVVWLADDASGALAYLKRAVSWWGLDAPVGVSVDGAEGPGAYGLNRNVNLTVLVGQRHRVTANFALVQPSDTDAPRILAEVTRLIGGEVPSADELRFLSSPTRSLRPITWKKAPADVELRGLLCALLAARDEVDGVKRAASAVEKHVAGGGAERGRELGQAASLMVSLSIGSAAVRRVLRAWSARYGSPDARRGRNTAMARNLEGRRPLRFDMGPASSPAAPGFRRVGEATTFAAARGFGWLEGPPRHSFRRTSVSPLVSWGHELPPEIATGVSSPDDMTFRVALPDGRYTIEVQVGDPGGHVPAGSGRFLDTGVRGEASGGPGGPLYSMGVSCGPHRVGPIETRTYPHRAAVASLALLAALEMPTRENVVRLGNYRRVRLVEQARGGSLDLRFFADEALFRERLAAIRDAGSAESRRRLLHTAGGPFTRNSVLSVAIRPFVPPPLVEEDGALRLARGAAPPLGGFVEAFNAGDFPAAERVADSVGKDTFSRRHGRLLALMWLAGHPDFPGERRLVPRVLEEIEAALEAERDPSGPERAEIASLRDVALDFARGLRNFDQRTRDGEEVVSCMNRAEGYFHRASPGEPFYWKSQLYRARIGYSMDPNRRGELWPQSEAILRGLEKAYPGNRWVRYYIRGDASGWPVAEPSKGTEGAPEWAVATRRFYQQMLDLCEWWIRRRQDPVTGALGGEWGDDVELAPLIGYTSFICPDASPVASEGIRRFCEGVWSRSGVVDTFSGFFHLTVDAEHSSEFTGDVLGMMLHLERGNPRWLERALKTGKLMRDLWMGRNRRGHRLFRSSFLGAFQVPRTAREVDSAICGRAIIPALEVLEYNRNPELERLVLEYADTLLQLARSTGKGKPAGVVPGPVVFATGELGHAGSKSWWQAPPGRFQGMFSFPRYHAFRWRILTTAWRLTGDETYLEPLEREAELAREDARAGGAGAGGAGGSHAEPGSRGWTGAQLARAGAVAMWRDVQGRREPRRPDRAGSPLDKERIAVEARRLWDVARQRWPLMTDDATMTDRVAFRGCVNSTVWYCGARVSAQQIEPAVSYEGAGRDFAAIVLEHGPRFLKLIYYGFHGEPRDVGLRFWELEPRGEYRLTVGADRDGDDRADRVASEREFTLREVSDGVRVTLPAGRAMVLEVRQVKPAPAARRLADLGISRADIRYDERGHLLVDLHNLGSLPADDVEVAFYDGDPRLGAPLLGRRTVSHIEPPDRLVPQIVRVGIEWRPSRERHEITVVVDPDETIEEISERNNTAGRDVIALPESK